MGLSLKDQHLSPEKAFFHLLKNALLAIHLLPSNCSSGMSGQHYECVVPTIYMLSLMSCLELLSGFLCSWFVIKFFKQNSFDNRESLWREADECFADSPHWLICSYCTLTRPEWAIWCRPISTRLIINREPSTCIVNYFHCLKRNFWSRVPKYLATIWA